MKERECESTFHSCGPYWHAFTPGKNTPILFTNPEDMTFVMNVIAQAAFSYKPDFILIAFEVMNNHFHFVAAGTEQIVRDFFSYVRRRTLKSIPAMKKVEIILKPIKDLSALRNTIVYTHRNGYVADEEYTPFSYPWGSGSNYYCEWPVASRYADISMGPRRIMFRGRAPELPEDSPVRDGFIAPSAYCAIRFGMALFRDAHHYFHAISRQVEAYEEIAHEIGDDCEYLTDAELFTKVTAIVQDQYKLSKINELSKAQKQDLARAMHYDYRSSNGQIRRILGLSQFDVNALFPLSAER